MSVTADRPRLSPAPPDRGIRPRRWTRDEYYRAAELGPGGFSVHTPYTFAPHAAMPV